MKSLFDYIDGNSFLTTIIGIIVGWILNFISTMYFDKKRKGRRKKTGIRKNRKAKTI